MASASTLWPGDDEPNITGYSAWELEDSGAEAKAAGLQGVAPKLKEPLRAGRQRILPARKAVVDPSPTIRAEVGGNDTSIISR
jgi:hypothetical protein